LKHAAIQMDAMLKHAQSQRPCGPARQEGFLPRAQRNAAPTWPTKFLQQVAIHITNFHNIRKYLVRTQHRWALQDRAGIANAAFPERHHSRPNSPTWSKSTQTLPGRVMRN